MKTTLQFKLSFMFFMVMLISATVSISLLLVVFSPIMRNNAKEQLAEMAVSINTLTETNAGEDSFAGNKLQLYILAAEKHEQESIGRL